MVLKNAQTYLTMFGGIEVHRTSDSDEIIDLNCYYKIDAQECLSRATNEAYMIRDDGEFFLIKIPDSSPKPPRLYGHRGTLAISGRTLYLYIFGGRSPDIVGEVSNEMWRLNVPFSPIAYGGGGNTWEKITLTGEVPPALFGHSVNTDSTNLYIFGGADSTFTPRNDIYIISLKTYFCKKISKSSEIIMYNQTLWDGTNVTIPRLSFDFLGRIRPLFKFEKNNFVVVNGYLVQNNEILPVNQLVKVFQNSLGEWTVERIVFEDEEFRYQNEFFTQCSVPYASHVPQIHFVVFKKDGYLAIKHVQLDPTDNRPSSYTEVLTYKEMPKIDGLICTMGIGRGMIGMYTIDGKGKGIALFSAKNIMTTSMYDAWIGLKFCKLGYSGTACEPDCPTSVSFSDGNMLEKMEVICSNRGSCVDKVCICNDGWTGDDCSVALCPNNCSNDDIADASSKNICIINYPESYCSCAPGSRRAGDDCSKIFCLNECGDGGECQPDGTCKCADHRYGPDCSIFEIELYKE